MNNKSELILFLLSIATMNSEAKVAEVTLQAGAINGTISFTESVGGIHVTGFITGLPVGLYGLHVHEIGDVTTCDAAGPHFNPEGNNHGGRNHSERHVGDFGNVLFEAEDAGSAIAYVNFVDNVITFNGTNNILNRTLVLHEQEDDLGLGGHETSLTTGNAGARVACGIIREVDSGVLAIAPSLTMFVSTVAFMLFSLLS